MIRQFTIVCVSAVLLASACSEMPTAPSPSAASSAALGAEAKPGSGPTPSPHTLSIGTMPAAERQALFPSPGHFLAAPQTVSGWITGPTSTGFKASATSAAFTMTLVEAHGDQSAPQINTCTQDQEDYLISIGLLGSTVTGALTLTLDYQQSTVSDTVLKWALKNIGTYGGYEWDLDGGSGSNNPLTFPRVDPSSSDQSLTVSVENGGASFKGYVPGARRNKGPAISMGCRIDFKMTMTKQ